MSALLAQLRSDLTAARKAQDKMATQALSTLLSEAMNREIELSRPLTDDEVIDVVGKSIKKRRESADLYAKNDRADLAANERAEITLFEKYMPAAANEDDVKAAILAAIAGGATNVGAVMGQVLPKFKGRFDGGALSALVRAALQPK